MDLDEYAHRVALLRARCNESIRISNEMVRDSKEWLATFYSRKRPGIVQDQAFVEPAKPWSLLKVFRADPKHPLSELITHLRVFSIAVVASAQVGDDLMIVIEQRHEQAALEMLTTIGMVARTEGLQQTGF